MNYISTQILILRLQYSLKIWPVKFCVLEKVVMRNCVECNQSYSDDVLFCPKDGELVLIGAILKETYCIEEKLGEGGMAMVFKATNILTNTPCAIKIIRPDMITSEINAVERLLLEALKIKKVNHPNIVEVLDFGPINEGLVYLTMELLTGKTLKKEINQNGPLNYKKAGFLVEQICAGMQAAHERGIIHRDIKSENIFLLDNIKNNISLKILDFGISSDKDSGFSVSKQIIGTPEYMSPEQCEGKNLDVRSDIYSLGITIYEMLTGSVPFPLSLWEPYEIIRKQMFEQPKSIRRVRKDIPQNIEQVVFKALEKNRERRQQSIAELAKEFASALRNEGIIEDKTNLVKFNVKELIRNCINQGLSHLEENEYEFAINCFNEAIDYDFNNHLAYFNCGLAYQGMGNTKEAISNFDQAIEIDPNYAEAYFKRGLCHQTNNELDLAIEDFSKVIELDSNHIEAFYNRGLSYKKKLEIEKAENDFSTAVKLNPKHASSYYNLGLACHYNKKVEEAISTYGEAIRLDPNNVNLYVLRAFAYKTKQDLDNAMLDCYQALKIDPDCANAYYTRSLIYQAKATLDLETANKLRNNQNNQLSDAFVLTILGDIPELP